MNALHLDHRIGHAVQILGAVLMVGALGYGFFTAVAAAPMTGWRNTHST